MSKDDLIHINNELNSITGGAIHIDDQSVNHSLKEYHENMNNKIKSLAQDAFNTFNIFVKLYLDENDVNVFKDCINAKPVFDTYGNGIELSFTCSKKEEKVINLLNVFKSVQILNFMDFYQRFNTNEYIKQSIELFTDAFKNRFYKFANTHQIEDSIDCMKNYFGMEHGDFEVMVSRQEIVQNIRTLADSISNSEILTDKKEMLDLIVKDKNRSQEDTTIVIDKFTIYRDEKKHVII
jgi:hypothetical protein